MVTFRKQDYIPEKGDIVWLDFNPQIGREQRGHRPALILTSRRYNQFGMCLACPITSKPKGQPFEVTIVVRDVKGSILVNHMKSQDWQHRKIKFIGKANSDILKQVKQKLLFILEL